MNSDDLFREFDRLFAELSLPLSSHARRGSFNPNADVFLTDGGRTILVRVELAGVSREHIKLVIEGSNLYLAGIRETEVRGCDGVLQKEIEYGYFFKRIPLPGAVDSAAARAHYHGGMLTVRLPVTERAALLPVRRTEIRMAVRSRA